MGEEAILFIQLQLPEVVLILDNLETTQGTKQLTYHVRTGTNFRHSAPAE